MVNCSTFIDIRTRSAQTMFLLIMLVSFGASTLVRMWMTRTYGKWSKVTNRAGIDGHTVARHILDSNGLQAVKLEQSQGMLSDHYIPSQKLIRLSQDINNEPSALTILKVGIQRV